MKHAIYWLPEQIRYPIAMWFSRSFFKLVVTDLCLLQNKTWNVYRRTWSEIVNLTAVTTVVLIKGDGEFKDRLSLGKRFDGSISVSLPKHSATTFLVPSSTHSQCRYNCCHMAGTNGRSCSMPAGVWERHVITCKTAKNINDLCLFLKLCAQ